MSKTPNQWQSPRDAPPPANKPLDLVLRNAVEGRQRIRNAKARHHPDGAITLHFFIGESEHTQPLSNVLNWRLE